jgi:hypothetical protein
VVGVQGWRAVRCDRGTKRLTVLEDPQEMRRTGWRRLAPARATRDGGQIAGHGANAAADMSAFVTRSG